MQRFVPRLFVTFGIFIVTFYVFARQLDAGGRLSEGYGVGAIADYFWVTVGQNNLALLLGVGGLLAVIGFIIGIMWLLRGKPSWLFLVTALLLVTGTGLLGWGLGQSVSGTLSLDSEVVGGTQYHLSVWRGVAPGGWQIWSCNSPSTCTVIQTIDHSEIDGLTQQAATYPARFEVSGTDLSVVISQGGEETRVVVER
jgi:hypothetical protein